MMYQPIFPSLPNLDNPELLQDLSFHLKELYWDITSLVKEIEVLKVTFLDTPQNFEKVRFGMVDVTSGIEHDVTHHLAETLRLSGQVLGKPSLRKLGEQLTDQEINWENQTIQLSDEEQTGALARLNMELEELAVNLQFSLQIVETVTNFSAPEETGCQQLEDRLKQLAEVLGSRSWLAAQKLYGQAFRLEQVSDPLKQAQEDYLQMLSTPLNENYHPDARDLDFCPNCSAKLTGDDRTFRGSYCEECRTAWIDSSEERSLFG